MGYRATVAIHVFGESAKVEKKMKQQIKMGLEATADK